MAIKLKDVEIRTALPELTRSLRVIKTKVATIDKRKKAIDHVIQLYKLGKPRVADVNESTIFASSKGIIQYYRPSGALWTRNFGEDNRFKNECRPWRTIKVADPEDKDSFILDLSKIEKSKIRKMAEDTLSQASISAKDRYFAGISLQQVAQLDEKGNELGRYAGEATAQFHFRIDRVDIAGPGAKTYVHFNPRQRGVPVVSGLLHFWRERAEAQSLPGRSIEEVLEKSVLSDGVFESFRQRKGDIVFNDVTFAYYAMSPTQYQSYLFPVIKVKGAIRFARKSKAEGVEFARYFHAVEPSTYRHKKIFGDFLLRRL